MILLNHRKIRFIFLVFLALSLVAAADILQPIEEAAAANRGQTFECLPILWEAAQQAGIPGEVTEQYGNDGTLQEDDIYCFIELEQEKNGGLYSSQLSIRAYPIESSDCQINSNTTFYGYDAYSDKFFDIDDGNLMDLNTFGEWYMRWVVEEGGYCHQFEVSNSSKYPGVADPDHYWYDGETDFEMPDVDPVIYAETLWSVVEPYLPFSIEGDTSSQSPPYSDDTYTDENTYTDDDTFTGNDWDDTYWEDDSNANTNKVPVPVIIGSIGVPAAGAVAGTVLSILLSTAGTAKPPVPASSQKPRFGSQNENGLVWSPRPWDEAGPGFVPQEEYLRTKDFLDRGYQWTNQGWKTPDEIQEYDQWQANDDAAIRQEDQAWREQWERDQQALEQKRADLEEKGRQLNFAENFTNLQNDLDGIYNGLKQENIYVANPYQGDPTMMFYGLNTLKNIVWDNTAGILTGDKGLTCGGFVDKTKDQVLQAVGKNFPGAKLQNILIEEKSTIKPDKSVLDWCDSIVDDNHNLFKVILPDGSEWAVDFHQYSAGNAPLMRPWAEVKKDWGANYLKDEYFEAIRKSQTAGPKQGS